MTPPGPYQVIAAGDFQMGHTDAPASTKTNIRTVSPITQSNKSDTSAPVTTPATVSTNNPELGIPAYWTPPTASDTQLLGAAGHVGFVIANVDSGPGTSTKPALQTMISQEEAAGIKVYGYVSTVQGSRPLSTVKSNVTSWYGYYKLDGIMFDQAPGGSWTAAQKAYYQALYSYVKAKNGSNVLGTTVVLNAGAISDQYAMSVSDILGDFEGIEAAYANAGAPAWTAQYPANRFWNIVDASQGTAALQADISLAKTRNVGYVYVTTASGANPYTGLPASSFWLDEIGDL